MGRFRTWLEGTADAQIFAVAMVLVTVFSGVVIRVSPFIIGVSAFVVLVAALLFWLVVLPKLRDRFKGQWMRIVGTVRLAMIVVLAAWGVFEHQRASDRPTRKELDDSSRVSSELRTINHTDALKIQDLNSRLGSKLRSDSLERKFMATAPALVASGDRLFGLYCDVPERTEPSYRDTVLAWRRRVVSTMRLVRPNFASSRYTDAPGQRSEIPCSFSGLNDSVLWEISSDLKALRKVMAEVQEEQ